MNRYMFDEDGNSVRDYDAEERDIDIAVERHQEAKDYRTLKRRMTEFQCGRITRDEYKAAHYLYQRANGWD